MVRVVFFNDTATTEIYTLSLHDALPISSRPPRHPTEPPPTPRATCGEAAAALSSAGGQTACADGDERGGPRAECGHRSEEHTSELQSRQYLVCRLLLEKKKLSILSSFYI